jgi:voltage-dependent potassium channel beta subunit
MQYRKLGRHGIRVSAISLGSWVTYGGTTADETAVACIRKAWDLGVNFFDTADAYEAGLAEQVVGKALKDLRRSDLVLATKCYFPITDNPNDRGLSRKHVTESVDASLKRLGTDYVDLFQCHRFDTETPLDETVRTMDDLVRRGKVLYWGVSMWTAVQMADAHRVADRLGCVGPASDQPAYSMVRRDVETDGVLDACAHLGMGVVVYSPLAQGVLTGKYKPGAEPPEGSRATTELGRRFIKGLVSNDDLLARVQDLDPIAKEVGCTMAQLALAWVLRRPEISSCITGASRPEQVEDNVKAAEIELSDDVLAKIDEALGAA